MNYSYNGCQQEFDDKRDDSTLFSTFAIGWDHFICDRITKPFHPITQKFIIKITTPEQILYQTASI